MIDKDNQQKTRCTKRYRYTAKELADLTGVSESYVKKLRAGDANKDSDTARLIVAADVLLGQGSDKLLEELERVLTEGAIL